MAGTIDKRLGELGIELPPANAPAGNYVPFVRTGDLLFTGEGISQQAAISGHEHSSWYEWASGAILILLISWSLIRIGPRGMLGNLFEGLGEIENEDDACCDDC